MKTLVGKISWFGGSADTGVGPSETLALYQMILASALDKPIYTRYYCAMRWDYPAIAAALAIDASEVVSALRGAAILVTFAGVTVPCVPVDWGPALATGRLIDVGPEVIKYLGCTTDDLVQVLIPDWCSTL